MTLYDYYGGVDSPKYIQCLDDFLTVGPLDTKQCAENLANSIAVCGSLGLPLHPDKCICPSNMFSGFGH